ncbi:MAG: OmpA family protein [Blastochloris sp.]|nr:OmpA family protein [Blastochloris sp.]
MTARPATPSLGAGGGPGGQVVVELPLKQVDFEPETTRLSVTGVASLEQILPVLRASSLYLQIQGGAAWPGPEGRYTAADIATFANERAVAVRAYLAQQGIDPNRLVIGEPLTAQCPNCLNEADMAKDRIVRFELLEGGR